MGGKSIELLKKIPILVRNIIFLIFFFVIFIIILYSEFQKFEYKSFWLILFLIPIIYYSIKIFDYSFSKNDRDEFDFIITRILTFALITLSISPLLVYTISLYFKINKSFIVKVGSISDWIQFSGSLIGGCLTLIAIAFTINYERGIRNLESKRQLQRLINELRPIIDFSFQLDEQDNIFQDTYTILVSEIINESNQHAFIKDIEILDYKYKLSNVDYDSEFKKDSQRAVDLYTFKNQILAGKTSKEILFSFPLHGDVITYLASKSEKLIITFTLNIHFTDIQDLQTYSLILMRSVNANATYNNGDLKVFFKLEKLRVNDVVSIVVKNEENKA